MSTTKDILFQISNISRIKSYLLSQNQNKDELRNEILKDHDFCKKLSHCIMQYICTRSKLYEQNLLDYLRLLENELNIHISDLWNGLGANEMYWFLEHAPLSLLHDMFVNSSFVASCSTNELLCLQQKRPELAEFYKTHWPNCPK